MLVLAVVWMLGSALVVAWIALAVAQMLCLLLFVACVGAFGDVELGVVEF